MKTLIFAGFLLVGFLPVFSQVKTGRKAPEIALLNLEGNRVTLSDLKGRVVLIDFWASWCGPCRYNNPRLVRLYQKYHEKGFEILGVSLDNNTASWKQAVIQDKLEWIQVNDNQGWDASAAKSYRVNAIPVSFLLDKDGIVRAVDMEGRALEAKIKSLLKSQP